MHTTTDTRRAPNAGRKRLYRATLAAAAFAALAAIAPHQAQALTVVTDEFAFATGGNTGATISSGNSRANLIRPGVSGTAEAYSFWIDEASFAFSSPRALRFDLMLSRDDPGGQLYETPLANVRFTNADFEGLTSRAIANGRTYLRKDWDLSSFDIDINAGEDLAVVFTANPAISLLINDTGAPGGLPAPDLQNFALGAFQQTQATGRQSLIYQLTVEDGVAVSAVPLPAALPMMLTALGGLFVVRRRRRAA